MVKEADVLDHQRVRLLSVFAGLDTYFTDDWCRDGAFFFFYVSLVIGVLVLENPLLWGWD
jgi:hypothetical protein